MKTFTMTFDTENADFEMGSLTVADIIRDVANKLDRFDAYAGNIRDNNGNKIGAWSWS